jgi:hypothetical protein
MTFHRLGMENHPNFPETVGNGNHPNWHSLTP